MKKVLFIHGAGMKGSHQENSELILCLQKAFGKNNISNPKMPEPGNPKYTRWKEQIEKELMRLDSEVILIGHSLGGSVLLKYLSEETCTPRIAGLFIIAAPYWGKDKNWQSGEFILQENFHLNLPSIPQIIFYHSSNDEVVPLVHQTHYLEKIQYAASRILNDGHWFKKGLPELVNDIHRL
ncbi:alpha/beta hydrolase [Alteribacillus sp. YIM 98480]|uniref:alpha/beta hydrolase n=1 Tax=Alteribacillus sp. YIM 98480 TaxID=2606599 RepID=UPI001E421944|nr:alpha/beta hydrolase [Alteribacillus sp. YIM 98480]